MGFFDIPKNYPFLENDPDTGLPIFPPEMQNQQPVMRQAEKPAVTVQPPAISEPQSSIPKLSQTPAPSQTPQRPYQAPMNTDWFDMGQPQPLHIQQTQWQMGPRSNPTYQEPHWAGATLNNAVRNGLDAFLAQGQYPGMAPFQQPGTVMPKYNMTQTPLAEQLGAWNPYQPMPFVNIPYGGNFMGATPATLRQASTVLPFSMPR